MKLVHIPKGTFKARALEIFRRVQDTKQPVVITDRGRPVLILEPFYGEDNAAVLASLSGSVQRYSEPTQPVGGQDWEALEALDGD